jgi:hypothetical protein
MRQNLLFFTILLANTLLATPDLSSPNDSIYQYISTELANDISPNYTKIAESLNLLSEEEILKILKDKGILRGEHVYDADKLWQLHLAALCLGEHSNIAVFLRRTNKFQTHFEAKERVKNEISEYVDSNQGIMPKWLDFNDLTVVENKELGVSNADINGYFRVVKTRYTDDEAWCAAYVGAKMKAYKGTFTLPQNAYRAASYGGFNDSGFNFFALSKKHKNRAGRYENLPDLTYLPNGQVARYHYTIDDFKDKNKIPLGALVIFKRQGGGHIGFIVGIVKDVYKIEDNGTSKTVTREGIILLGGNQNDAVQFEVFYDLDKIQAVTMPTDFLKADYSAIPTITAFYDLPEFYERSK